MISQQDISALVAQLEHEYAEGKPQTPLATGAAWTVDDGYRVQAALVEQLIKTENATTAGYKIALTSPAMQAMVGVDQPLYGVVLSHRVHSSPYALDLNTVQRAGLEFEIAVELKADIATSGRETRESVASSVGAIRPAFEIVEDRNANYDTIDAFSLIADNAWNGGNVLGPAMTRPGDIDLASAPVELVINGDVAERATTAEAMGHPYEVVAWVANQLSKRQASLTKGMLVMTGSCMKTRFPAPGDHYEFRVAGAGSVFLDATGT